GLREDKIAEELGLTEQALERRKRIVGLSADDMGRIARVREQVVRHAEEYTSTFFSFLSSLDEVQELFRNRQAFDLARKLKMEHLAALVSGQYGVEYAQQRIRLGVLYSRAGLETRVFLGAFHQLLRAIGLGIIKN